jgi:hypothetical protein
MITLNRKDHPVGARVLTKYPSYVDPEYLAGKLFEATVGEWSPGGRVRLAHCFWSEPADLNIVEILP